MTTTPSPISAMAADNGLRGTTRRGRITSRRNAEGAADDTVATLYAGELEIRPGDGLVLAAGQALTLSVREFELLLAMASRLGSIVTREALYEAAWHTDLKDGDRSVDVYVSRLRRKLKRAMPEQRFIHTHPGFGYRFQPDL